MSPIERQAHHDGHGLNDRHTIFASTRRKDCNASSNYLAAPHSE